ncbi:MAG TPA: hypothetical protein VHK91_07695 [Flavisolibacter sp.]|nr:hypothetical protein [Flavisolibacter sp.]
MESPYQTPFSRAVLTGLFIGIASCILCIAYNIFFRQSTGFPLSDYINVSSLIFAVNLLFFALGILYYVLIRYMKKGEGIYIALLLAATVYFAVKAWTLHRSGDPVLNSEFHELFGPMVLLMGCCAAIGIPYCYHNRKFQEEVI